MQLKDKSFAITAVSKNILHLLLVGFIVTLLCFRPNRCFHRGFSVYWRSHRAVAASQTLCSIVRHERNLQQRKENKVSIKLNIMSDINSLTGSRSPLSFLPRLLPSAQPIFASILKPLLVVAIELFMNKTKLKVNYAVECVNVMRILRFCRGCLSFLMLMAAANFLATLLCAIVGVRFWLRVVYGRNIDDMERIK